MGLDHWLIKSTYIGAEYIDPKDIKFSLKIKGKKFNINTNKINAIEESLHDWRKFNALHKWFVDNVQNGVDNCERHLVNVKHIKDLLAICISIKENHSLAKELLPTREGFFFGNTEYDEWYFKEIDNTIKILKQVIEDYEQCPFDIYYESSW